MSKEKYMVIYPDGSIRWIEVENRQLLPAFYKAIGCDCVENVRTIIPDVCLIVDECGKLKNPPQPHNDVASQLYAGWILGSDNIVGPVVVAAIHLVDGESDWVPLSDEEMFRVQNYLSRLYGDLDFK